MKIVLYFALLLIGLVVLEGCVEQPDICHGVSRTAADFTINEVLNSLSDLDNGVLNYDTDTITNRKKLVRFSVNDLSVDSAIWTIGTEKYNAKRLTLDFSEKYYTQKLFPIRLTVYKKANTTCFNDDIGVDSKTRLLTVLEPCDSKLKGKYIGYNENNPNNTFTVSINSCEDPNNYPTDFNEGLFEIVDSRIINIPVGDTLYSYRTVDYGYKATTFYNNMYYLDNKVFVFNYKREKVGVRGEMWLIGNNEIKIQYFLTKNINGELVENKYTFKGTRTI